MMSQNSFKGKYAAENPICLRSKLASLWISPSKIHSCLRRRFQGRRRSLCLRWGAALPSHVDGTICGSAIQYWLVVWNIFPTYWEFHNPNWLSYFFRGVGIPPTRIYRGLSRIKWIKWDHHNPWGESRSTTQPLERAARDNIWKHCSTGKVFNDYSLTIHLMGISWQ